jgi:hypothetical protein
MSHYERWNAAARAAVVSMNVASANAAGFDLDEYVVGANLRFLHLGDFHLLIFGK